MLIFFLVLPLGSVTCCFGHCVVDRSQSSEILSRMKVTLVGIKSRSYVLKGIVEHIFWLLF